MISNIAGKAIPRRIIQNQLAQSKSAAGAAASNAAMRASSSGGRSGVGNRGSPESAMPAARECLRIGIRKPPEIMRLRRMIDHRELRVPECIQTFRAELPPHPGLLTAAEGPGVVIEERGIDPYHAGLQLHYRR